MLVQGRRAGLRPRRRRPDDRVPELGRERHVPLARQRAREPHVGLLFVDFVGQKRLRLNGVASIADDDPLLSQLPAGAADRPGAGDRGVPELPALHPQDGARRAVALHAARRASERRSPTGSAARGRRTRCRRVTPRETLHRSTERQAGRPFQPAANPRFGGVGSGYGPHAQPRSGTDRKGRQHA